MKCFQICVFFLQYIYIYYMYIYIYIYKFHSFYRDQCQSVFNSFTKMIQKLCLQTCYTTSRYFAGVTHLNPLELIFETNKCLLSLDESATIRAEFPRPFSKRLPYIKLSAAALVGYHYSCKVTIHCNISTACKCFR